MGLSRGIEPAFVLGGAKLERKVSQKEKRDRVERSVQFWERKEVMYKVKASHKKGVLHMTSHFGPGNLPLVGTLMGKQMCLARGRIGDMSE